MEATRFRLSENYPRMLAGFGAWAGSGIALMLLAAGQYLLGGVLVLLSIAMLVLAIRGGRYSERAYSTAYIVIQWIMLAIPIVLAILIFILAFLFFRPFTIFAALYLVVLLILAVLAGRELRRRVPADQ